MSNSNPSTKPAKPYPDFPLFPHATKRWAKKIRGKLHYFGAWSEPDAALQKFLNQQDDLRAGRRPKMPDEDLEGLTVRDLCNQFLTAKHLMLEAGDIVAVTFADYYRMCNLVIEAFGKTCLVSDLEVSDFEALRARLAKQYGVHRLGNTVQRVRILFKYGLDAGL